MAPTRRSPRPLVAAFVELRGQLAPQTTLGEVQSAWRDAVGATIAERARPVAERGGTLTISCESSVWAQELDLMTATICQRLNELLDGREIVKLRCVATPSEHPFAPPPSRAR